MYGNSIEIIAGLLDVLISYVTLLLCVGVGLEIVGGLLIFFGIKPKLGAIFLSLYIIGSTLIYFPFWFYEGAQLSLNFVLFMKNLSILGGVFLLFSSRRSSYRGYDMMDEE
ncbi:MAG: hypothetical protein S4CHLAM20_06570 [Chlamydiia bacterium]|nr:hypothetical protein [Chlamydiia bacterium]